MNHKKFQVFVSSTYKDMLGERQAAVEAILEMGHIPAGMELFSAGNVEQLKVIKRWIDQSDIFMLILGGRYGSIELESQLSYVECEFRYAISIGKPIFSLVISDELLDRKVRASGISVIENLHSEKYAVFKREVLSKLCAFFSSPEELKSETMKSLSVIPREHDLVGWIRANTWTTKKINVQQIFYPFLDPMKHKGGTVIPTTESDDTWNSYVLNNVFSGGRNIRWIYGPYRTLPIPGRYMVEYRLKLQKSVIIKDKLQNQPIIELDIYDFYGGKIIYATRKLSLSDLSVQYKAFRLEFMYQNIESILEYRVAYIHQEDISISISIDQITVERLDD